VWPRTCISCAVIVSAPASVSPHVPATSLASPGQDSAKTNLFKSVFDSLALFEDLEHQGGAQQGRTAHPISSNKKDASEDQSSGTGDGLVLQAAIAAQAPIAGLSNASLVLATQPEQATATEDVQAPDETPAAQTSSPDPSGPSAALAYSSLPSAPLAGSVSPTQARLNVPAAAASPANAAGAAKGVDATVGLSETQSTPDPDVAVARQLQPAKSPSMPPAAVAPESTTESSPEQLANDQASELQTAQPETTPVAPSLPTRTPVSGKLAQPVPTKVAAPQIARVATGMPVSVKAPADSRNPVASSNSSPVIQASPVSQPAPANEPAPIDESSPVEQSSDAAISAELPASPEPGAPSTPGNVARQKAAPTKASAAPAVPTSKVSPVQSQPEPIPATAPVAASTTPLAPVPAPHEVLDRTSETPGDSAGPLQHETSSPIQDPKAPLVPQAENFAFALRMLGIQSVSYEASPVPTQSQAPLTTGTIPLTQPVTQSVTPSATPLQNTDSRQSVPAQSQSQTSSDPSPDAQPPASEVTKSGPSVPSLPAAPASQPTHAATPHWNDAAVWQTPETGSTNAPEPAEAAHVNLPLAAQEAHLLTPEAPKAPASSEILLHLTGNDQSSAAIRVADRAGAVNVSVHASDPVLRESLRANLGDLSNQLSTQGWKADLVKSAPVATPSGSQQDSHAGEQRGSQQQQSFGGDRQSQRDRRAGGGQWQQELDQQVSGGDAHTGGKA